VSNYILSLRRSESLSGRACADLTYQKCCKASEGLAPFVALDRFGAPFQPTSFGREPRMADPKALIPLPGL
jgi:hypothetical protein